MKGLFLLPIALLASLVLAGDTSPAENPDVQPTRTPIAPISKKSLYQDWGTNEGTWRDGYICQRFEHQRCCNVGDDRQANINCEKLLVRPSNKWEYKVWCMDVGKVPACCVPPGFGDITAEAYCSQNIGVTDEDHPNHWYGGGTGWGANVQAVGDPAPTYYINW